VGAACKLDRIPWDLSPPTMAKLAPGVYDPEQDTWELYYLPDDFSQAKDLAAENPEKLAELKELFWEEAEKHNALPLLAALSVFFGSSCRRCRRSRPRRSTAMSRTSPPG
jgi:arylsulfatase